MIEHASKDSWWVTDFSGLRKDAQQRMRSETRAPGVESYLKSVELLEERENCGHETPRTTLPGRPEHEIPSHLRLPILSA